MNHLNEYRGIRDAYGRKAVAALAKRFKARTPIFWEEYIEKAKRCPLGQVDGLMLFAPQFADMTDWAAVTRFCFLADRVWEMECEELAEQNANRTYPDWQAYGNKRPAKAA